MQTTLKQGDIITGRIETYTGTKKQERFTVKKFLGAGGTGLVYLCCGEDNKNYALKELYPKELEGVLKRNEEGITYNSLASQSSKNTFEWYKNNLKREAMLCQKASISRHLENNDPFYLNCLGILIANETTIYAIYETYKGRTLAEYLEDFRSQENPDYTEHLVKMLITIAITANKLHHIHLNNILHLDITPANIFLVDYGHGYINKTEGEIPCLLDFGNACDKRDISAKEIRFSFSEGYSAPELLIRSKDKTCNYEINERTDVYSLVAILYEALIGEKYDNHIISKHHREWMEDLNAYPEIVRNDLCWILEDGLSTWEPRLFYDARDLANTLKGIRSKLVDNNEDLDALDFHFEQTKEDFKKIEDTLELLGKHISLLDKIEKLKQEMDYEFHGGMEDEKYKDLDVEKTSAAELCEIGLEYRSKKRYDEAFKFFELAYNKGNIQAGGFLGFAYGHGRGVEKNKKIAMKLLLEACEKKDSAAMLNLGASYFYGDDFIKKNYSKAIKIFKKLSTCEDSLHYKDSFYYLGKCYENGYGVIKNKKKALALYEKAQEKGCHVAQRAIDNLIGNQNNMTAKR